MQSEELLEKAVKSAMLSVIKEHPMGHWRDDQVKEVARRAIIEAALSAAEPVAWVDEQELRYLEMVSRNKAWADFQRSVKVGGEKEGRLPLSAQVQDVAGWQSIETAPKDGTQFLAFDKGSYFNCWWHDNGYGEQYWMDDAESEPNPSHWMPLPVAPAKQDGGNVTSQ